MLTCLADAMLWKDHKRMPLLKTALVSFAAILVSSAAGAAIVVPDASTPFGSGIINGNLALATDGNLGTGYVVTNSNTRAQGFNIRFDFDISAYSQVTAFVLHFAGIYSSDQTGFQGLRIGAGSASNFINLSTPIGQQVSATLVTTSGGSSAFDIDNYISGNYLSVYITTQLGNGPGSFTQINTLEISGDIQGQLAAIESAPEPSSVMVWGGLLAVVVIAVRCERRFNKPALGRFKKPAPEVVRVC